MFYRFLPVILLIFSCGVKQPVEPGGKNTDSGSLFVQSDPSGALIFLDSVNTFLTTPDTLKNIPVGIHHIRVLKDGYELTNAEQEVMVNSDSMQAIAFSLTPIQKFGFVYLQSDPAGAQILINNEDTGKTTPDTIKSNPGVHLITLRKNGFKISEFSADVVRDSMLLFDQTLEIEQRILLESFANVSCIPCVEASENLSAFAEQQDHNRYAIIEYFANWPSANDPFNKVSPKDVEERLIYYNVAALPALRIAGDKNPDPSDADQINSLFNNAFENQNSPVGLSINRMFRNDSLKVRLEIFNAGSHPDFEKLRLFVAIIENEIHLDEPPGSNGLKDFEFVFRKFLSSKKGDTLETDSYSESVFLFAWPDWDYNHCRIIAFIQNTETKEIIQTTIN